MGAPTTARLGACIASSAPTARSPPAACSRATPPTKSSSCSPRHPTRSGPGTSPSSWGRPLGSTSTSTLSSTSSAAASSDELPAASHSAATCGWRRCWEPTRPGWASWSGASPHGGPGQRGGARTACWPWSPRASRATRWSWPGAGASAPGAPSACSALAGARNGAARSSSPCWSPPRTASSRSPPRKPTPIRAGRRRTCCRWTPRTSAGASTSWSASRAGWQRRAARSRSPSRCMTDPVNQRRCGTQRKSNFSAQCGADQRRNPLLTHTGRTRVIAWASASFGHVAF
jgi:hypothetical protein